MHVSIDDDAELRLRQLAHKTGLPMSALTSWAIKELWSAYETGRWKVHDCWQPRGQMKPGGRKRIQLLRRPKKDAHSPDTQ